MGNASRNKVLGAIWKGKHSVTVRNSYVYKHVFGIKVSEKIPLTKMEDKYERVLKHCEREVDRIIKLYKKQKDDPPVPRMFPPIAGNNVNPSCKYVLTPAT